MTGLTPYLHLPGTAREALTFYRDVFGGNLEIGTFAAMGRSDGPGDAVGHGMLQGPVTLFASDTGWGEVPFAPLGIMFALLGTAEPEVLERWFAELSPRAVASSIRSRSEPGATTTVRCATVSAFSGSSATRADRRPGTATSQSQASSRAGRPSAAKISGPRKMVSSTTCGPSPSSLTVIA